MAEAACLNILLAEDAATDRRVLASMVRGEGHQVRCARDGVEALKLFQEALPDLVLLDVMMPEMDGFETAREMRRLADDRLVPIIFLTAMGESDSLVQCLEAGGDDFLPKPYNRAVIQAKVKSFGRMRELHETVRMQRNRIASQNRQLIREQTVAKQIFDKMAHSGCLDDPRVRYYLSPRAIFNGDVLVAARHPSGRMLVLLGDFTGHGLPAALGAMPLSSVFHGMVHKGFATTEVIRQLNGKLRDILPVGVFCCATVAEFDFRRGRATVWNGGLPEGVVQRAADGRLETIRSRHLPLGVLPPEELKLDCQAFHLWPGDRCYLWSDGIQEARDPAGNMFGDERLHSVLTREHGDQAFPAILDAVEDFVAGGRAEDDVSLVEVRMGGQEARAEPVPAAAAAAQSGAGATALDWTLNFELEPSTIRRFDPLPLVLGSLTEIPGVRAHSGPLYTILSELYSNALDHGLLRMDSALKDDAQGFGEYYRVRQARLDALGEGRIGIVLRHRAVAEGGRLTIEISDSGPGFAHTEVAQRPMGAGYSGRGIALVRSLCESLRYWRGGNSVEAVYRWR